LWNERREAEILSEGPGQPWPGSLHDRAGQEPDHALNIVVPKNGCAAYTAHPFYLSAAVNSFIYRKRNSLVINIILYCRLLFATILEEAVQFHF
jgi:hypothetical protein